MNILRGCQIFIQILANIRILCDIYSSEAWREEHQALVDDQFSCLEAYLGSKGSRSKAALCATARMPAGRPAALKLPEAFRYRSLFNNAAITASKKPNKAQAGAEAAKAETEQVVIGVMDRLIDDVLQLACHDSDGNEPDVQLVSEQQHIIDITNLPQHQQQQTRIQDDLMKA